MLNSNVIGAYHAFEACRLEGVSRIVVDSSITVGDEFREEEPYRAIYEKRYEDVPPDFPKVGVDVPARPRSLYAASKVWAESLARVYAHQHGMSCLVIRIGQVERDRPRLPQGASIFVSMRDIVQLWERCIHAPESLRFDIFWGMSNNDWRWVDIDHVREVLGYVPQDRAEDNWKYD